MPKLVLSLIPKPEKITHIYQENRIEMITAVFLETFSILKTEICPVKKQKHSSMMIGWAEYMTEVSVNQ